MSRVVRAKNNLGATKVYDGNPIDPGEYYDLDETDKTQWKHITEIFTAVANSHLIINKGADTVDDFTDPLKGWNWLAGETEPPQSSDGDWHFVNENFAHVTGNDGINWSIERELENNETYSEILVMPNNRHATINMMVGGSDQVASSIVLEWYEELSPGEFMRTNPWIRKEEIVAARIDGAARLA